MTFYKKAADNYHNFRDLSQSLSNDYLQQIIKKNTVLITGAASLVLVIELYMITRLFIAHPTVDTLASKVYLTLYLSLLLCSILLLAIQPYLQKNPYALYWLHFSFTTMYLVWNVFLNTYDLYRNDGGSCLAIVIAIIFSSILLHFKPHHMMLLQVSTFLLFYCMNYNRIEDSINATIAIIVSMIANILFYYQEVHDVYKRQCLSEMNAKIEREQLEGSKHYLRRLQEAQEHTMIFHHDLRHTLNLLDQMARLGELDKIQSFISANQEKLDNIQTTFYCEHEIINLILGSFEERAATYEVQLKTELRLPSTLPVEDTELCSLFYNLLENALHAVTQVHESYKRYIFVKALIHDNNLVILVENPFIGTVLMKNDRPLPLTKSKNHGFGIQSIITIAEHHNGLYFFECEEQVFRAKVLLRL